MKAMKLLAFVITIAVALAGTARSQIPRPGVGPSNPNRANQDLQTMQQIQLIEEQRRLEADHRRAAQQENGGVAARDPAWVQAQVAKFLAAIKRRKHRYADFDQVVTHGKAPVTPEMLAAMAESPFAADIAYYLGKHPDQSLAIAQMQPAQVSLAVRKIEATVVAQDAVRQ